MRYVSIGIAVLLLASVPIASGAGVAPIVEVTVDGEEINDGEQVDTNSNPIIEINATVDPAADNSTTITSISVELDGKTYKTFDVNSEQVIREIQPDLTSGVHDFRIIVEDSADEVTTFQFDINKDRTAPDIWLTAPYKSAPYKDIKDATLPNVPNNTILFEGQIDEASKQIDMEISRYHVPSSTGTTVSSTYTSDTFSEALVLGPGRNKMTITVKDAIGNEDVYRFSVFLTDTEPPTVEWKNDVVSRSPTMEIRAAVTDTFGVKNITFKSNAFRLDDVVDRSGKLWKGPKTIQYSKTVDLEVDSNFFHIIAWDANGNVVNATVKIERKRPEDYGYDEPTINIDETKTRFTDDRTLQVVGEIDGDELTFAKVQTVDVNGDVIDIISLHNNGRKENIPIDQAIDTGSTNAKVVIEVQDSRDAVRKRVFWVNAAQKALFTGGPIEGDTPEASDGETGTPNTPPTQTETETSTDRTPTDTPTSSPTQQMTRTPGQPGFGLLPVTVSLLLAITIRLYRP